MKRGKTENPPDQLNRHRSDTENAPVRDRGGVPSVTPPWVREGHDLTGPSSYGLDLIYEDGNEKRVGSGRLGSSEREGDRVESGNQGPRLTN